MPPPGVLLVPSQGAQVKPGGPPGLYTLGETLTPIWNYTECLKVTFSYNILSAGCQNVLTYKLEKKLETFVKTMPEEPSFKLTSS